MPAATTDLKTLIADLGLDGVAFGPGSTLQWRLDGAEGAGLTASVRWEADEGVIEADVSELASGPLGGETRSVLWLRGVVGPDGSVALDAEDPDAEGLEAADPTLVAAAFRRHVAAMRPRKA